MKNGLCKLFLISLVSTVSLAAQARVCQVNCIVKYNVDLGTVLGTGRTCEESDRDSDARCQAKDANARLGASSCVELGTGYGQGAKTSRKCFAPRAASTSTEVTANTDSEMYTAAQSYCRSWCSSYSSTGSTSAVGCEAHAGACVP